MLSNAFARLWQRLYVHTMTVIIIITRSMLQVSARQYNLRAAWQDRIDGNISARGGGTHRQFDLHLWAYAPLQHSINADESHRFPPAAAMHANCAFLG